jgi:hypothetical protein
MGSTVFAAKDLENEIPHLPVMTELDESLAALGGTCFST